MAFVAIDWHRSGTNTLARDIKNLHETKQKQYIFSQQNQNHISSPTSTGTKRGKSNEERQR
jgi:hypothetical protein